MIDLAVRDKFRRRRDPGFVFEFILALSDARSSSYANHPHTLIVSILIHLKASSLFPHFLQPIQQNRPMLACATAS